MEFLLTIITVLFLIGAVVRKFKSLSKEAAEGGAANENFPFPDSNMPQEQYEKMRRMIFGQEEQSDGRQVSPMADEVLGSEVFSDEALAEGGPGLKVDKDRFGGAERRDVFVGVAVEPVAVVNKVTAGNVQNEEGDVQLQGAGTSAVARMMNGFSTEKAVIYAEIIRPKYEQY